MVKTMVCCFSFIVQKVYGLLRATCGFLDFLPLDMFSNRPDVKPARAPICGSPLYTPKGGAYMRYQMRIVYILCIALYTFDTCNKSVDSCTTYRFISIQAIAKCRSGD